MRAALFVAFVSTFLAAWPAAAQPVCDRTYTVRPGDSLSVIALLVSGDASRWREVYTFGGNQAQIGANPNALLVGMRLEMPPCEQLGSPAPPPPTPASVATTQPAVTPNPAPRRSSVLPVIDIVTGDDFRPFTGQDLHREGMATEILMAAFAASDLENEVRITFVNDWASHLTHLVKYNKFNMAYPWSEPDCSNMAQLPQDMHIRCEYVFSDPIYVTAIKVYMATGSALRPRSFDDLQGSKICRPTGWLTFDLAERGLLDGQTYTLVQANSVSGCFEMLERGEVDYVSLTQFPAETAIANLGLGEFIEEVRGVVNASPIHLVAHGDNAEAAYVWLEQFNIGLERIKRSGQWDQIVNDHLDRFRASIGR